MTPDPLYELLSHLATGPVQTLDDLAGEMGVQRELLQQMLQDLARAGYIESFPVGCQQSCRGCRFETSCRLTQGARVWTLTEKGLAAVKGH